MRGTPTRMAGWFARGTWFGPATAVTASTARSPAEALVRVRKGWVATPGADVCLVAAARAGVVLSCITQARRLGLWVLDEDRPHVAAPAHSGGVTSRGATVHWAKPVVPRHPDALIDPIENVLALVALCQPFEPALAVWESALRKQLVDRHAPERMALPTAARKVLVSAFPFSDSGLESFIVPRLKWMRVPIVPQVWIARGFEEIGIREGGRTPNGPRNR